MQRSRGCTHPGSRERQYLLQLFLKCTAASQCAERSASLLARISCSMGQAHSEASAAVGGGGGGSKVIDRAIAGLRVSQPPPPLSTVLPAHRQARTEARARFQLAQRGLCLLLGGGIVGERRLQASEHSTEVARAQGGRCRRGGGRLHQGSAIALRNVETINVAIDRECRRGRGHSAAAFASIIPARFWRCALLRAPFLSH